MITFDSSSLPNFYSRKCMWKYLQNVCHIIWLFSGFFVDVLARIFLGCSLAHWQLYDYHIAREDVIKWKHYPLYWPFVRGIHRSPVNSPHKGQRRRNLMFSLICAWINGLNNREASDLRPQFRVATGLAEKSSLTFPWHFPDCRHKFQSLSWYLSCGDFYNISKTT